MKANLYQNVPAVKRLPGGQYRKNRKSYEPGDGQAENTTNDQD